MSCPVLFPPPAPRAGMFQLAVLSSFTALTDHSPKVWEEVNQSGQTNRLKKVQWQDVKGCEVRQLN